MKHKKMWANIRPVTILTPTFVILCALFGCEKSREDHYRLKITGGRPASLNDLESKYTVSLVEGERKRNLCSGTLIGPNTVLTAAHCVIDMPHVEVALGLGYENNQMLVYRKGVSKAHPEYALGTDGRSSINDIAVIHLTDDVANPSHMQPAVIADASEFGVGTEVSLAGYGRIGSPDGAMPGRNAEQLLFITKTKVESFDAKYPFIITYRSENGVNSACKGDSGGPMFIKREDGTLRLVGATRGAILSDPRSMKCLGRGTYTSAVYFTEWIASQM